LFQLFRSASASAPSRERTDFSPKLLVGDGHEVEPLAQVRSADPRCTGIKRPDGVTLSFQVSTNSVEPLKAVWA
jgi:hypothetical protein